VETGLGFRKRCPKRERAPSAPRHWLNEKPLGETSLRARLPSNPARPGEMPRPSGDARGKSRGCQQLLNEVDSVPLAFLMPPVRTESRYTHVHTRTYARGTPRRSWLSLSSDRSDLRFACAYRYRAIAQKASLLRFARVARSTPPRSADEPIPTSNPSSKGTIHRFHPSGVAPGVRKLGDILLGTVR